MLSGQYMPETFGGAQQQCGRLSEALVQRGVTITVFTNRCSRKLPKREEKNGVTIVRPLTFFPPQTLGKTLPFGALWLFQALVWISSSIRAIDILHAHQCKFQAYIACLAGRLFGKPVVAKPGNAGSHDDLLRIRQKFLVGNHLYRTILRDTTMFVAISSQIETELLAHGVPQGRIARIPNGISQLVRREDLTSLRESARKELRTDVPADAVVFLFAGRLEPVKNLKLLLEGLARQKSNFRLWIFGDGPEREHLVELAQNLGIAQQVEFRGYVSDLQSFYLAADFLAMSSDAEGLSNTLLEAMSVGLVPVSTPVSGATDLVIPGGNGFLSEDHSVESYAAALNSALSLPESDWTRMSEACHQRIADTCEIGVVAARYEELYKSLLNAGQQQ